MSLLSDSELSLMREKTQSTRLFLSIYQPRTVFSAQVNSTGSSVTHGSTTIYYDTVSSGSYSSIVPGQTMLVGTYAGAFDKGRIRVKGATGTYVKVAPNEDINWADNDYINIIDFHEVWSKYAYFNTTLDSDDDIIIYKDGDIAYTNQNTLLGSLINMGGNYAGFIEDPVYYSATGTVSVKGTGQSFLWEFSGGSPTGSTSMTPGNVSYSTPGHYTTSLKVYNASGTFTDIGYRHISIYDHFANQPVKQWGVTSIDGSREDGGYSAEIWVKDTLGTLLEGSLVTLFSESIYGETEIDLGGNSKNRSSVVFSGYIVEGSIAYDYQTSTTSFTVASITDVMKRRDGMSISVDSVNSPTKWQQVQDLNMKKALYHYLKWHSTVTEIADISYIGYDYPVKYLETDMESLYDGIQAYLENRIDGSLVSDRQGRLYVEPGIRLSHSPTGTYSTSMDIYKQDWMGEPEIEFVAINPSSYIDLGGFAYAGSATGTSKTLLANAPGNLKSYSGSVESGPQGLVLLSQTELNRMVGDYYAYQNARYPDMSLSMTRSFLNMDIAPYEIYMMNMDAVDNNRGIVFNRKPFHIKDISWEYDPKNMTLLPDVSFHEITQGFSGKTIPVPVIPEENYPMDWNVDPFSWEGDVSPFIPSNPGIVPPEFITPPPDVPDCRSGVDTTPNGPIEQFISGTLYDTSDQSLSSDCLAWARPSSSANRTSYTINGQWMKRDATSNPIGAWASTTDDNFYQVYLLDGSGNRVATAIKDPVTDPFQRTGVFNNPAGVDISGMEIALTVNSFANAVGSLTFDSGSINNAWGKYPGGSIWLRSQKVGTAELRRSGTELNWTEFNVSPANYMENKWFRFVGDTFFSLVKTSGAYVGFDYWEISSGSGPLHWTQRYRSPASGNMAGGQILAGGHFDFLVYIDDPDENGIGTFADWWNNSSGDGHANTDARISAQIIPEPTYQLAVNSAYLWNLCAHISQI